LREARRRRELTLIAVARRAGYSNHQTVHHWESGGPPWRDRTRLLSLVRAYRLYRTEAGYLLTLCGYSDTLSDAEWQEYGDPPEEVQPLQLPRSPDQDALESLPGQQADETGAASKATALAERRQVTMLTCYLSGLPGLADHLSHQALQDLVDDFHHICTGVITGLGGHVLEQHSESTLACFGYPTAHEDDARRAARAGLVLIGRVELMGQQLQSQFNVPLAVSVTGYSAQCIITGREVRGASATLVMGESGETAAVLRGFARPGSLVISEETFRLLEGVFSCRALETNGLLVQLGAREAGVYQVFREIGVRDRVAEVAASGRLSPLVGREEEIQALTKSWGRARQGWGQVVLLRGDPGIGKSRLVQVLRERLAAEQHVVLEGQCLELHQQSPLRPIIEMLERLMGLTPEQIADEKLERLEQALATYHRPGPDEAAPLLASLLSLQLTPDRSIPILPPSLLRQKTLEAVVNLLLQLAKQRPVLFILEDLHWSDASTLDFLELLVEHTVRAPVMAVLTFRPEFQPPPWVFRDHVAGMRLGPLPRSEEESLVVHLLGGVSLAPEAHRDLLARTGGVPLYIEELVRLAVESLSDAISNDGVGTSEIPPVLRGGLTARLDRLPGAWSVAQLGAAIGQSFSYDLLKSASIFDESEMQRGLRELVGAGLLYQRGLIPDAAFTFKHALIRDQVYQSLTSKSRRECHQRIATSLAEDFPEVGATQPEVLAHHFTEAGFVQQAIIYSHLAGEKACQRGANVESISHFIKGLELLDATPATLDRSKQEIALQLALGAPLIATKGYAAPEVERAYSRARELCHQLGEIPQLFPALWGLGAYYYVRAELRTARRLWEECERLAQRQQDQALILESHHSLGAVLFSIGELALAREHVEQAITLYDPPKHRALAPIYAGQDPGVVCLSYAAWVLWYFGYPDQALKRIREALTLAQEISHPYSLTIALLYDATLHQYLRHGHATQENAEAAIALSIKHGFPLWCAWGTVTQGWALAAQGQVKEGIALLRQGLRASQATGAALFRTHNLALLAEAHQRAGQSEEGLGTLAQALAIVDQNEECFYQAELHRLKGDLLLQKGGSETEAKQCFQKAIDVSQHQGAKSLELRATTSLCRLLQLQGKTQEAGKMLAEIYGWFTEGFDTADLLEAKQLLEELCHPAS
jgi:predicted ATPase/class 3 adenylate cyclase